MLDYGQATISKRFHPLGSGSTGPKTHRAKPADLISMNAQAVPGHMPDEITLVRPIANRGDLQYFPSLRFVQGSTHKTALSQFLQMPDEFDRCPRFTRIYLA
jgi:hypothetical protein